eukprot:snap_masked-scaffold_5-processed-gene-2.13-mRNA-1 protein AED:1.00 eAED:1.00 QI:0/0/0/0/1/1/2/0/62
MYVQHWVCHGSFVNLHIHPWNISSSSLTAATSSTTAFLKSTENARSLFTFSYSEAELKEPKK